jgi:hypothetical protein
LELRVGSLFGAPVLLVKDSEFTDRLWLREKEAGQSVEFVLGGDDLAGLLMQLQMPSRIYRVVAMFCERCLASQDGHPSRQQRNQRLPFVHDPESDISLSSREHHRFSDCFALHRNVHRVVVAVSTDNL